MPTETAEFIESTDMLLLTAVRMLEASKVGSYADANILGRMSTTISDVTEGREPSATHGHIGDSRDCETDAQSDDCDEFRAKLKQYRSDLTQAHDMRRFRARHNLAWSISQYRAGNLGADTLSHHITDYHRKDISAFCRLLEEQEDAAEAAKRSEHRW